MHKAIFLDKDGTLVENVPYNVDLQKLKFCEGAYEALKRFSESGFKLFIVSNQSGVAKGHFKEDALLLLEKGIRRLFSHHNISLDGFYYCPHYEAGIIREYAVTCPCRKPKPGMLLRAAEEHHLNLKESWMVGDILNDVEAGNRAGCRSILIENGNETEWKNGAFRKPYATVSNLIEAAEVILMKPVLSY
jgi:D-glycero-D-manno-heptose 1,7-bisphosphate phosphatase